MATTAVSASAQTLSFSNQIGCGYQYGVDALATIIVASDTLADDDEANYLLADYENTFSTKGPDEPAVLLLLPDDDFFHVIAMQETKHGRILTLRILTENGWIDVDPGQKKQLRHLAKLLSQVNRNG